MKQSHMKYVSERDEKSQLVPGHYYLFNWVTSNLKKSKILDIGCWNGHLEILFEKTEHEITGIDLEEEPLLYARKKYPKYKFFKANVASFLPFKKNEFDAVLYFMVIEHIPRGKELNSLKNINKVLKAGGLLYMSTMNDISILNFLDPAYILGHRHYSKKELCDLLKKTGFEVEEVHYNAGIYTTFHMFLLYFFKHVLRRKEPRNRLLDILMERDYRNKGFVEIDIKARKVK